MMEAEIESHFNKKYKFKNGNEKWILPPVNELWTGNDWKDENLLSMKDHLNSVKNQLNDKERGPWSTHTQSLNPAGDIITNIKRNCKPELCTQAWAKCFEILKNYEDFFFSDFSFNQLCTIHLCEAPGAFITSLNHFIFSRKLEKLKNWKWIATTLNPYYEGNSQICMINDDRFILNTLDNWEFGVDNTGDIMNIENLEKLDKRACALGEISLITADGSVGCHENPSEQEDIVSILHYCEVITAFSLLKNNGHFVVKMFTFFESRSITLLYLLNCFFRDVHLFKPGTSKEGNSEVYVICLGFEREKIKPYEVHLKRVFDISYHNKLLLRREHIPQNFIDHVYASSKFFCDVQTKAINRNVALYPDVDFTTRLYFVELREKCWDYFMRSCKVNQINDNHLMVSRKQLKARSPDLFFKDEDVTFNDIEKHKCMSFQEKILNMKKKLNDFMVKNKIRGFNMEKWFPDNTVTTDICLQCNSKAGFEFYLDLESVIYGKSFSKVQSSRFSCQFLINLWNEAIKELEFPEKLVYQINFPLSFVNQSSQSVNEWLLDLSCTENIDIKKQDQHLKLNIIHLKDSLNIQKSNYVNIENLLWIEALIFIEQNITIDGDVFLLTENLFTRFIVGCLYILCHYFAKVTLLRENSWPQQSQIVIIKAQQRKPFHENTCEFLTEIRNKLLFEETETASILEIVPVQQVICDESFYNELYGFNKLKLAQQLHYLFKDICNK